MWIDNYEKYKRVLNQERENKKRGKLHEMHPLRANLRIVWICESLKENALLSAQMYEDDWKALGWVIKKRSFCGRVFKLTSRSRSGAAEQTAQRRTKRRRAKVNAFEFAIVFLGSYPVSLVFLPFSLFRQSCLGNVPLYIVIAVGFIFCLSSHFVTPLNICVRLTP